LGIWSPIRLVQEPVLSCGTSCLPPLYQQPG